MELKDMTIEALEERKSQLLTDMEAEGADLDAIEKEMRAIKEELENRKAAEAKKAEVRNLVASGEGTVVKKAESEERKTMTNAEVRNTKEYIDAYVNAIKTGDDAECRALLTENVSGTIPVPEMVYDIVKNAWENEGIMRLIRKSYVRGNLKVGFEISATGAVKHTEGGDAINEQTLVLGTINIIPVSLKKFISISDEAMDLRGETFLNYIYDELTHYIAKKAADEVIAAIELCGTESTTTCVGVPVITSTTINVGLVAEAMAQLSDQAANPVVIMNKATWGEFKKAQIANKYNYDPFEGLPVVFNNTIESFTNATTGVTYAIVGDLGEGALANFPNGEDISIEQFKDKELATKDLVGFIGRQYVGIGIVGPNSFVKIQH